MGVFESVERCRLPNWLIFAAGACLGYIWALRLINVLTGSAFLRIRQKLEMVFPVRLGKVPIYSLILEPISIEIQVDNPIDETTQDFMK